MFSIFKNNFKKILIISLGLGLCFSCNLTYAQETSSAKKELDKTGINNSLNNSIAIDSSKNSVDNSMSDMVDDVVNKANPQDTIPEYKKGDYLLTPDEFLHKEDVTIESVGNKIEEKMFDVISLLQTFAKPFSIIMFIISAINVVVGIVFNTKKHALGYLGLIFSVLMYVGVIYAPNLVVFFVNWLSF